MLFEANGLNNVVHLQQTLRMCEMTHLFGLSSSVQGAPIG